MIRSVLVWSLKVPMGRALLRISRNRRSLVVRRAVVHFPVLYSMVLVFMEGLLHAHDCCWQHGLVSSYLVVLAQMI